MGQRHQFGYGIFLLFTFYFLLLSACSITKQISKSAKQTVIEDSSLRNAHLGISIYEPATGKYWYNYNGDKYFVPASNTKLPTCYAAMKYLGDSLVGMKYGIPDGKGSSTIIVFQPAGDPTFLHADYKNQRVYNFLLEQSKNDRILSFMDTVWKDERWGSGWSWNDYDQDYMAERNSFPIYGNVIDVKLNDVKNRIIGEIKPWSNYRLFSSNPAFFDSVINGNLTDDIKQNIFIPEHKVSIERHLSKNFFTISSSRSQFKSQQVPFVTFGNRTALSILENSFHKMFPNVYPTENKNEYALVTEDSDPDYIKINEWKKIHSQPTDSLLKPMMHRSDNFFAEQSLLMVSNEILGVMNDAKIIDTLLKTDFKDLPQKPRWADGSGLSRYNLFTPQDFVAILNKMKNEFGMNRIKEILPTGGKGTISSYYKADSGYIYVKTGTLSGVVALSGFLYTKKNKLLIFSTLVNNHNNSSSTGVRRAVEKFIQGLRDNY